MSSVPQETKLTATPPIVAQYCVWNLSKPSTRDQTQDGVISGQDLDRLERVWALVRQFEEVYKEWKDKRFADIVVKDLDKGASCIANALMDLGHDISHWPVWIWLKA